MSAAMVDLRFEVEGDSLPGDYAYALYRAVAQVLPWLEAEPGSGIHPLKGAPTDRGTLLVSRRSRLILRLPAARVQDAQRLTGCTLDIAGAPLLIGPCKVWELMPVATLYAWFVTTGSRDEAAFLKDVAGLLEELGTRCKFMCGKSRRAQTGEGEIAGFSVMLHEVLPEESVALQQQGLGRGRLLGCGMLVPHKSIRAVRREE